MAHKAARVLLLHPDPLEAIVPTYDHGDHTEVTVAGSVRDRQLRAAGAVPAEDQVHADPDTDDGDQADDTDD